MMNNTFNNVLLKKLRKQKPYAYSTFRKHMSKTQLGIKLGVSGGQICRYKMSGSGRQYPKLKTFKRMCIVLQVDPKDLLGIDWIDGVLVDDNGKLYLDPEKEYVVEYKVCPTCKMISINQEKGKKNYEKKVKQIKVRKEIKIKFV